MTNSESHVKNVVFILAWFYWFGLEYHVIYVFFRWIDNTVQKRIYQRFYTNITDNINSQLFGPMLIA